MLLEWELLPRLRQHAGIWLEPCFLSFMRIPGWFIWPLLYGAGIFAWMVFFEHGPGWGRFQEGAKVEVTRAWEGLKRWSEGDSGK